MIVNIWKLLFRNGFALNKVIVDSTIFCIAYHVVYLIHKLKYPPFFFCPNFVLVQRIYKITCITEFESAYCISCSNLLYISQYESLFKMVCIVCQHEEVLKSVKSSAQVYMKVSLLVKIDPNAH